MRESLSAATVPYDIVLIHDGSKLRQEATKFLEHAVDLIEAPRDDPAAMAKAAKAHAAVVCCSKIEARQLPLFERLLAKFDAPPVFLFPTYNAMNLDHAKALGGEVFVAPLDVAAVVAAVRRSVNIAVEASWKTLSPAEATALKGSLASFKTLFQASTRGERMPLRQVYAACDSIQETLGASNIDRWLHSIRQHHDSTFRHSMFVCGALAYFSHAIGVRGEDLKELTVGAFLHDAGKAMVPLEILNKPGKLDDAEWAVMCRHPEYSEQLLAQEEGLTPDIVAMAVSHHEKLDGTGYPHNLRGGQINDFVRLTSIADVFAALIEPRAYKPPMSNEDALDMMCSFDGHLDRDLLKRFREYVLDSSGALAA